MNKPVPAISADAMNILLNSNWVGNVRELENAIERALVIGRGPEIGVSDLPMQEAVPHAACGRRLEDVAQAHIERVLEECGWNLTHAAEILGIDRSTLYNKIKLYGLKRQNTIAV